MDKFLNVLFGFIVSIGLLVLAYNSAKDAQTLREMQAEIEELRVKFGNLQKAVAATDQAHSALALRERISTELTEVELRQLRGEIKAAGDPQFLRRVEQEILRYAFPVRLTSTQVRQEFSQALEVRPDDLTLLAMLHDLRDPASRAVVVRSSDGVELFIQFRTASGRQEFLLAHQPPPK